ncbi:MAG: Hydrolase (HAD superfamily) protein [candidate division CPR2 bacterium GW2011_GWC1_41_48]|uniref:Hydrolase (HAD superfamily) protein n=1 Tax=candidate division CPR2 bacterium GW2011_GWC1_41_48 TaxID=1618344 RepID=A0A0G0W8Y9_UNCC2|nr:MAG: Hydrolase (HAD superfamily) protein [candidate division CPR2 bacterium GW2011_GWC2_39_35]KKR28972.1 MAG: Hydrolase (HAD superfamily) protein [candidate division CPR2 bacterium GW2011_GWD2_39_7]KKS09469.1 MAG: Hydrolase (HAD superfamily) protein [candidate division CPR2 bacterium GW2011_GWC1_41_48]OGB70373.1 MAG: hypothetical protein A2Y26_00150 [candidate division CPR2 bacterium GWD2_39_7]
MSDLQKILTFLHEAENLKSTIRALALTSGRKESAAEHSWRMALMTFIVVEELGIEVDLLKVLKMVLVHDLPECITGDFDASLINSGELSAEAKEKGELEAMAHLKNLLPSGSGEEIYKLWYEYQEAKTKEAIVAKAMDRLEALIQFGETGYKIIDHEFDFLATYGDKWAEQLPEARDLLGLVKKDLKREYLKGGLEWKDSYNKFMGE